MSVVYYLATSTLYSAAAADFIVAFLGHLLLLHQDKAKKQMLKTMGIVPIVLSLVKCLLPLICQTLITLTALQA